MTDKDRIDRLERVLETLVSWLHRELGTLAAQELLKDLRKGSHD
jgi:excinuclease UvrABC helicase subunit UvrB